MGGCKCGELWVGASFCKSTYLFYGAEDGKKGFLTDERLCGSLSRRRTKQNWSARSDAR